MRERNKRKTEFTVPNILSCIRLVCVAVFCLTYFLSDNRMIPFVVMIISVVTDFFDGFIARHFDMCSELGKILDPAADKLFSVAVLVCLTVDGKIPLFIVAVILIKEICMVVGGLLVFKRVGAPIGSKWYGKLATAILFFGFAVTMFFDAFGLTNGTTHTVVVVILGIGAALTLFAGVCYAVFVVKLRKSQEGGSD